MISAPSGSGKTTLIRALRRKCPAFFRSVSVTTRSPRRGERKGGDYWFVSSSEFARMHHRQAFLESAAILGHRYGTPRGPIERALGRGRDVLLGVDIQGAAQIRRSGLPATTIFLLPPSWGVLRRRLEGRGTETTAQIQQRLRLARREMKEIPRYDYAVVNHRVQETAGIIQSILTAEKHRVNP